MFLLMTGFVVSALCALAVIRFGRQHPRLVQCADPDRPQRIHVRPATRFGGIGIVAGIVVGLASWAARDGSTATLLPLLLVLCTLPAFVVGLAEDWRGDVRPAWRLAAAALSGGAGVYALDAVITRTALPGLDWMVSYPVGAAALTMFVVAGVANAVNIIDGVNGLASMCAIMMLISLSYVAFQVGDHDVALLALLGTGAVLGFFFWNYPAGLIFLGDGGAYFLGVFVSELAILLLHRNPSVSPLFPLLLCIYPVFETLFSIYRRRVLRDVSPGMPDGIHLHSLVYRRLVRWAVGQRGAKELTRRNSMTAPYLWLLCMMSVVPAVLFWDRTPVLGGFIVLFGITYVVLYWRIVRFKAPRWLVSRR